MVDHRSIYGRSRWSCNYWSDWIQGLARCILLIVLGIRLCTYLMLGFSNLKLYYVWVNVEVCIRPSRFKLRLWNEKVVSAMGEEIM
jgi:hypothetical protein